MQDIKNQILAFHNEEDGATSTEYAIVLILIACIIIGMVAAFGSVLSSKFEAAKNKVDSDVTIS